MAIIIFCLTFSAFARAETLRIVSFNLWHGYGTGRSGRFEALESKIDRTERERAQARVLVKSEADVYLLQEFNGLPYRAEQLAHALAADLQYQVDAVGVKIFGRGYPRGLSSGLVTLTKSELRAESLGALSLDRRILNPIFPRFSFQTREEHFALFTALTFGSFRILLVNTHLHGDVGGDRRREEELSVLTRRISEVRHDFDAVVIGGDLNADPSDGVARRLAESGYRDAWNDAHPNDPGYTFDENTNRLNRELIDRQRPPSNPEHAIRERRPRRIDYIWINDHSSRVRLGEVRVIRANSDGSYPSDHYGVCVELITP